MRSVFECVAYTFTTAAAAVASLSLTSAELSEKFLFFKGYANSIRYIKQTDCSSNRLQKQVKLLVPCTVRDLQ
jgi:hypothetical protein